MKYIKQLILLMALIWSPKVFADHLAGGHFEYKSLGNNQYQIDFFFLRDCAGVIVTDNPLLYVRNTCTNSCTEVASMEQVGSSDVVDYGCGNTCLQLNDRPGYRLLRFTKIITLYSTPCSEYIISTAIDARNDVDFCSNESWYYNYIRINTSVSNDSPTMSGANVALGCRTYLSEPLYTVNQTNGDQIVYDFVPAMNGDYTAWCDPFPVTYEAGLNFNQPFPSTAPFILDQSNGSFAYVPTQIGKGYFAVRAREYRNGILISEMVIDGMLYATNCESPSGVTFNDFSSTGTNIMEVSGTPGVYCETVQLESNETIESVTVESPSFITYSVETINSGLVEVTFCSDFPLDNFCDQVDVGVVVNAWSGETSDCLGEANNIPNRGYYTIRKLPGEYCPRNLFFTNRNSTSGLSMPLYAHAEERIWVGDDMPAIAPPAILADQGQVDVIGDLVLEAGTEIVIPACQSGVGCVTFTGDVTLIINPNNCSADCTPEPFDLYVKEMFECSNERLIAEVGGDGPFTYQWQILGQTYTTSNNVFEVHNIVSEQNNGQIPYTCTVYDAIGQTATFTGNILGTQRFYQTITDNKIYFDYPPNTVYGPDGYYYAANLGVYSGTPAYIIDSVNLTPPWYGSTYMRLIVWGRNGLPILDKQTVLEGGEDWSMDNGEFYWNGKEDNDIWGDCYEGQLTEIFNYTLISRNCFDDQDIYQWVDNVDEAGSFWIFGCTNDDPWNPVETKSASADENDYSERNKITGWRRNPELPVSTNELFIQCIPNPTSDEFEVIGNYSQLDQIQLLDQAGKVVYEVKSIKKGEKIDVSHLSAGIYLILIETAIGQQQYKLIKQ